MFEANARELKMMSTVPLPSMEDTKTELAVLTGNKENLLTEYRSARSQTREYQTIKKNVDALLSVPKVAITKIHFEI